MALIWKKLVYDDEAVLKSLFDANTILAANSDNTPAAVTIAEQRIVSRLTGGNIVGNTIDDVLSMLTDTTTNNVSTSKHGLTPKLPNDATKFLGGTGNYSQINIIKYKANSEAIGSTTLQDDDDFVFTLEANTQYHFVFYLALGSSSTGGFKFKLNTTVGSVRANIIGTTTSDTAFKIADLGAGATADGFTTYAYSVNEQWAIIMGTVLVGGTGGTLTLQWAQSSAVGTSYMVSYSSAIFTKRQA